MVTVIESTQDIQIILKPVMRTKENWTIFADNGVGVGVNIIQVLLNMVNLYISICGKHSGVDKKKILMGSTMISYEGHNELVHILSFPKVWMARSVLTTIIEYLKGKADRDNIAEDVSTIVLLTGSEANKTSDVVKKFLVCLTNNISSGE